jgi:hypothetical protein
MLKVPFSGRDNSRSNKSLKSAELQIGRIVFGSQTSSNPFTITAATTNAFVADEYRSVPTVMIGFDFPIEKLVTPHNAFSTTTE